MAKRNAAAVNKAKARLYLLDLLEGPEAKCEECGRTPGSEDDRGGNKELVSNLYLHRKPKRRIDPEEGGQFLTLADVAAVDHVCHHNALNDKVVEQAIWKRVGKQRSKLAPKVRDAHLFDGKMRSFRIWIRQKRNKIRAGA